ncbi:RNA polymerase sigma factor [Phosphitispora fastidiosa]|uniref:RNA polymerase sigma factor n=1 Tax=Phosphitispora fastidiosa TaxID=2837202 RepID=UPI001E29D50D|nr:sigma-70 family RNA polymerase sigma factor [Phosphitispora fastidiosa]MBU7007308.1 RNA polymerase sigma-70 factor (ECF subfamily) [Phosphitispora fastidiosa]
MDITGLVKMARAGDEQAYARLIEMKRENLYRIALAYVGNEADCQDMLQEAYLKAYLSLNKLKNPEFFFTWLTRILINLCCSQLKRRYKFVRLDGGQPAGSYVDPNFILAEAKADITGMLDSLDEKYRQVLILKYLGEYTLVEISEILKCPLGTVKSRLNYGLRELREKAERRAGCD